MLDFNDFCIYLRKITEHQGEDCHKVDCVGYWGIFILHLRHHEGHYHQWNKSKKHERHEVPPNEVASCHFPKIVNEHFCRF